MHIVNPEETKRFRPSRWFAGSKEIVSLVADEVVYTNNWMIAQAIQKPPLYIRRMMSDCKEEFDFLKNQAVRISDDSDLNSYLDLNKDLFGIKKVQKSMTWHNQYVVFEILYRCSGMEAVKTKVEFTNMLLKQSRFGYVTEAEYGRVQKLAESFEAKHQDAMARLDVVEEVLGISKTLFGKGLNTMKKV